MTAKPETPRIDAVQARLLHLAAQGLLQPPARQATRATLLAAISRMQLLQIDTIHVVARSPYLVLHARVGAYPATWLDELLARGSLFECWAHEACFAPMHDHALHRALHDDRAGHWARRQSARAHVEHGPALAALLERIRAQGPVMASDFEAQDGTPGGWWGWKSEKRWLEALFARGDLMIARRERFQRVYDLSERVLARGHRRHPPGPVPDPESARQEVLLRSVRALGIAQARWIADYFRTGRRHRDADLDALVESGAVLRVAVDGWRECGYVHPEHLPLLRRAMRGRLQATHGALLSPFDPVVWDRERASTMFGFDYRLECYTPEPKRRFGYFVLPILHRGRLVGRVDAKAHRATGEFELRSVHLESGADLDADDYAGMAASVQACADWHGTPRVVVRLNGDRAAARVLRACL